MNQTKYFLVALLTTLVIACNSEHKKDLILKSADKSIEIDSLVIRYMELGRFSGNVFIMKADDVVYEQEIGLANYEAKKAFTKKSRFKVAVSDLKKAGIKELPELNQKSNQHLVTGYLYHNYRGNGLELEAIAIPPVPGAERSFIALSTQELAQLINTQVKDSMNFSGYLENDGFSYAVQYKPASQTTIIVLSNRRHPVADEMVTSLEAILESKPYQLPLARKPFAIDSTLLKEYAGFYSLNEQVKFEVVANKEHLSVYLGPNQVTLIPQSDNQFYMMESDAAMRFLRDTTGTVNRAALLNGFIESDQVAYRIK